MPPRRGRTVHERHRHHNINVRLNTLRLSASPTLLARSRIIVRSLLIIAMVYIVFMTLYNRYALHLSGFDQIPSLPRQLTHAFSTAGDWIQCLISKVGAGEGGLNLNSHHWSAGGRDTGVGGSVFGSGSREEEEAILGAEGFEAEDDVGDNGGNPWERRQEFPGAGMDSVGVIRL